MRNRFTRILLFAVFVIGIGYLLNLYFVHFTGDGKDSPEEALPVDADYEWIEGPKSEKEHRYFFLSNGNYFGTGTVKKNLKGWSTGSGSYSPLPKPLKQNEITAAYSDRSILFGLIKMNGNVKVTVNQKEATIMPLNNLSDEVLNSYQVKGYSIWYIELADLSDEEHYKIEVIDEEGNSLNELSI